MLGDRLVQRGCGVAQYLIPLMITLAQQSLAPDFPLLPSLEVQKCQKATMDVS